MPATSPATHPPRSRRAALAGCVAAVALLVGAAGCSSSAPSQRELSDALVASGLSKEVADCAASALTDSLTEAELSELTERGAGGAPVDDPNRDDDSYDKLQKAMVQCRDLNAASAPTTTAAPVTEDGATPSTIADGTEGAELNPESTTTTAP